MMALASLLLNILNIGILCVAGVGLIPTAMLFDAPGSERNRGLLLVFWMWMLFPLVALGSLLLGWNRWASGSYGASLKWGAVAPVWAALAGACLRRFMD